ncbi:MAG: hypothetical protein ACRDKB_02870 [Actinomycetota bacterium]
MKKLAALVLAAGLVAGLVTAAEAAKPKAVWEDETGDADNAQGLGMSIPGGFDLVEGQIAKVKKNLEFTAVHADMPPGGTLPEGFRFLWSFSVGDETYRLTAKTADIGKPDIPQGQTTERVGRVDLMGHFRLEGECSTTSAGVSFINCVPLEYLDGSFDPENASLTVIVPLKSIKAKVGSTIGPGAGDANAICNAQVCWVSHAAERSSGNTVIDAAVMDGSYKVPKK